MAEGELGFDIEFGHSFAAFGEIEERVVAEAFGAAWGGKNIAFDGTVADGEDFAVASGGEDAVVTGAALGEGNPREEGEEIKIIALVGGEGTGGFSRMKVVVVGVAGRADSGCAVESVDFEAGVVGDDDGAGSEVGVIDGLGSSVAFEGGFVFGGRGDFFEVGEWEERDVLRSDGGEVAQLAGI